MLNNFSLTLESESYFDVNVVLCCRSSSVDIGQLSDQLSQQQFYTIGMATNNFSLLLHVFVKIENKFILNAV